MMLFLPFIPTIALIVQNTYLLHAQMEIYETAKYVNEQVIYYQIEENIYYLQIINLMNIDSKIVLN